MYFAQQIDDVDYTNLVQHLISLYFEHDYENICKILNIEYNTANEQQLDESRYKEYNIPSNKYYKNGMIFLEDVNPVITKTVKIDEETNYLLSTLLTITSNVTKESNFINQIVDNWTKECILKDKYEVMNVFTVGRSTRVLVKVGQTSWNLFIKTCKNNRIVIQNGFKMAIQHYLNDICNNNEHIVI